MTVAREITSSSAISPLDSPRPTSCRTLEFPRREVGEESGAREPGRRARDVVGDEALEHARGDERLARRDGLDRLDEPPAVDVLEQEAARTRPQCLIDVLVEVERGEHEHLGG
jgi:hypothetical protein